MEISFICTKKRKEFGKPCVFSDFGPSLVSEIYPNPDIKENFFVVSTTSREVDNSTRMCAHEVNTPSFPTSNQGMNHCEGGWPSAVDNTDEESMTRFRKKFEKDKSYVNTIKSLTEFLENFIMENNSIDVYEEYFEGQRIKQDGDSTISAMSTFQDLKGTYRSVIDLSWEKDSTKFAAAYTLKKGFEYPVVPSMDCYVWDIENNIQPFSVLKPELLMTVVEFSPTNSNIILSGYESGQVALWDIRVGEYAQQLSTINCSHSERVTGLKWLQSQQETSFFSASTDGKIIAWDAKYLSSPVETVSLDTDSKDFPNLDKSFSVSSVAYDLSVPDNFMVGTEQGEVLSFNRKYTEESEKLLHRYDCKRGPVLAVERNSFFPQLFASCDARSFKIWSDAVTDNPVLNVTSEEDYFTDMVWSPTRASTLFTTKTSGILQVWDIPAKNKDALLNIRLDNDALLSVAITMTGNQIISGTLSGSVHLVNVPDYLKSCSELERDLVKGCIRKSEDIIGGLPRSERIHKQEMLQSTALGMDLEYWDPPEKAEDLYESKIFHKNSGKS